MKIKRLTIATGLVIAGQFAIAQVKTAELVKEWERSKAYTKEYLDAMPERSYALKPTPEIRSFAAQNLHLADANYGLAAAALGIQSPFELGIWEKTGGKSKANVIKIVLASYDFVIGEIIKLSDAQLDNPVKMPGSFDMSKRIALAKVFEHQVHHRGQTTVYLRLAGVTPPQEKLF
ncbi:DinB family protein [Hufsiella ginkgonis]|uniref:Damage-inducible protein DinB n=1 Tax=Hufsiella ginkgonis TaxID=2695274 RepID=A0A7K1XS15_9SPHI|nr:DinB family protein [Hufsiella ginkgonis]MXV13792.1 damage-inducible protein DinB [Hufsiella ginkgonis]